MNFLKRIALAIRSPFDGLNDRSSPPPPPARERKPAPKKGKLKPGETPVLLKPRKHNG